MQLLIDLPEDYETSKQTRSVVKRNISVNNIAINSKKPKTPKAKFVKCKLCLIICWGVVASFS
jgi:hypothetical protein